VPTPRELVRDDWVYEIKQDGYRVIGLVDGNSAKLYSMSVKRKPEARILVIFLVEFAGFIAEGQAILS
jgi:ATP-dependent DNA ligase